MSSRSPLALFRKPADRSDRRVQAAPAAWMPLWMTAGMLALAWTLGLVAAAWMPLPRDWQAVDWPLGWYDLGPWLSSWLITPRWHPMGWEDPLHHGLPAIGRVWLTAALAYAPLGMLLHLSMSRPDRPRMLGPMFRAVAVATVLAWLLVCGGVLFHGRPAWIQEVLASALGAWAGALLAPVLAQGIAFFFASSDRPTRWMLGTVQLPPWTAGWLAAGLSLGTAALVLPWRDPAFVWQWPVWQSGFGLGAEGWREPATLVRLGLAVVAYFGLGLFLSVPYLHQTRGQRLLLVAAMLLSVAVTLMVCGALAASAPMTLLQPLAAVLALGLCFARRRMKRGQKAVPVVTA